MAEPPPCAVTVGAARARPCHSSTSGSPTVHGVAPFRCDRTAEGRGLHRATAPPTAAADLMVSRPPRGRAQRRASVDGVTVDDADQPAGRVGDDPGYVTPARSPVAASRCSRSGCPVPQAASTSRSRAVGTSCRRTSAEARPGRVRLRHRHTAQQPPRAAAARRRRPARAGPERPGHRSAPLRRDHAAGRGRPPAMASPCTSRQRR